jgi:hypothetical protein
LERILEMTAMRRVSSDGRVTVVAKDHYLKKLIFISQQDYVAGARICSPTRMTKRPGPRGIPRGFLPLWAIEEQIAIHRTYVATVKDWARIYLFTLGPVAPTRSHFFCSIALASAASRHLRPLTSTRPQSSQV